MYFKKYNKNTGYKLGIHYLTTLSGS